LPNRDKSRLTTIVDLALFGFAVRNEPRSDVDLLVRLDEWPGWTRSFDLQAYLEELLGHPVDLVMDATLRPKLRPYIDADAINV